MSDGRTFEAQEVSQGSPDDDELMAILATGEMYPLAALYLRYGQMVRTAIRRFAPEISAAEAEEVGQDVFVALARSADRYRRSDRFRAWLYGIAANKARGWRRSTWVRRALLERHYRESMAVMNTTQVGPELEAQNREELLGALGKLPAAQREVLWLHAVDGFTGEEIAKILGIRPKTVWTRLHRARKAMMTMLASEDACAILCEEGS